MAVQPPTRPRTGASPPSGSRTDGAPYWLSPFSKLMAPLVARWPTNGLELFWIAPRTPPPLTAAKVVSWTRENGSPLLFYRAGRPLPLGYLELNPMPDEAGHLWLGHCVLDPEFRGCGLGRLMMMLMLDEGFVQRGADRISLVVFPDNIPALQCYRSVGFVHVGEQAKYFPTTGQQHEMLRMTIDARGYERGRTPGEPV